jgi:hypothetical protein
MRLFGLGPSLSSVRKKMALKLSMLAVGCGAAAGFMAPMHNVLAKPANLRSAYQSRAPLRKLCMLDVPRVELPSAVTDVLKEQNLKNPNKMTTAEYNSYSAAAVGGTLVFMLLLGPVTGIFDIGGAIFDFVFSALLGGGTARLLLLFGLTVSYCAAG